MVTAFIVCLALILAFLIHKWMEFLDSYPARQRKRAIAAENKKIKIIYTHSNPSLSYLTDTDLEWFVSMCDVVENSVISPLLVEKDKRSKARDLIVEYRYT